MRVPIDIAVGMTDEQARRIVDGLAVKGDKAYAVEQIKALYKARHCRTPHARAPRYALLVS